MSTINWTEVVEPAKGPRERKIESLGTSIIRWLLLAALSLFIGVTLMIFISQHLSESKLELDNGIGNLFSGFVILSAIVASISISKANKARRERNLLI